MAYRTRNSVKNRFNNSISRWFDQKHPEGGIPVADPLPSSPTCSDLPNPEPPNSIFSSNQNSKEVAPMLVQTNSLGAHVCSLNSSSSPNHYPNMISTPDFFGFETSRVQSASLFQHKTSECYPNHIGSRTTPMLPSFFDLMHTVISESPLR